MEIALGKKLKISKDPPEFGKSKLVHILGAHFDVFAWDMGDLPGVDPMIITLKLNVFPGTKPVKQKTRPIALAKKEFAKGEVIQLLNSGIIRDLNYSDWLVNVIVMPKVNRDQRVCVNFTSLKKYCPTGDYLLSVVDQLTPLRATST